MKCEGKRMNKAEFLKYLSDKLAELPASEVQKSLSFYSEIIDDRIEEGMSEGEAVGALGDIDAIVREIKLDMPLTNLVKAKLKKKSSLKGWEIILIIISFPIWFPLFIGFAAAIFSVYVSIWAVILSIWAAVLSFALGGLAGFVGGLFLIFSSGARGLLTIGASLCSIGIGVFAFFAAKELTKMLIKLTSRFLRFIKSLFIRKENDL